MMMFFALICLATTALAGFTAGPTSPAFVNTLKRGVEGEVEPITFQSCKFVSLNGYVGDTQPVKLYWTKGVDALRLAVEIPFSAVQQGGWLAVGSTTVSNAKMVGASIVIGYIDRVGNGFGYVAKLSATGNSAPTYDDDLLEVPNAALGVSQVVVGKDDQLIYTFNAPIEWADSDRAFLISYKDDSSFPVAVVPEAGTQLAGGKHTARLRLSNADFNNFNDGVTCNDVPEVDVAPTAAPPPPAPTVVPAPQCVANQQGNFDVETPFLLNGEWTHDCALQQTTFHFLADSPTGWVALGFKHTPLAAAKMSGVEFYMFNGQTARNAFRGQLGNGAPQPVRRPAFVGDIIQSRTAGILEVTFTRKWTATTNEQVPLDGPDALWLLVARSSASNFGSKHQERAAAGRLALFGQGVAPTSMPAPVPTTAANDDDPCAAGGTFEGDPFEIPFADTGDSVRVSYTVGCAGEWIDFTVTGESDGWLALGFNDKAGSMQGTDVYQMSVVDGTTTVRNAYAPGYSLQEDGLITEQVSGERNGREMTVTFRRAFDTGLATNDRVFAPGSPLYVYAARLDAADAPFGNPHGPASGKAARTWNDEPIDLFGAPPPPPCEGQITHSFSHTLSGVDIDVSYVIGCAGQWIDFTLEAEVAGWLAIGFNPNNGKMAGTDFYQVSVEGDDVKVRNGYASGYTPIDNGLITENVSGERDGDKLKVTFRHAFDTGDSEQDVVFAPGQPLFIHLAFHASSGNFADQHTARAGGVVELDLFEPVDAPAPTSAPAMLTTDEPGMQVLQENPCETQDSFDSGIKLTVGSGAEVSITWTGDCVAKKMNFTVEVSVEAAAWIAFGLSETPQMGNSDVYQMKWSEEDGASVRNGHTVGTSVIEDSVIDGDTGSYEDGKLSVTFTRDFDTGDENDRVLQYGKPYYILAAFNAGGQLTSAHSAGTRVASGQPVELFSTELSDAAGANSVNVLTIVHGVLMALAWILLSWLGTFTARFLKDLGHAWYIQHRAMMSVVVFFTVVGFIVITIKVGNGAHYQSPHSFIGIAIVVLSLVQPIIGILANRWWTPDRSGTPLFPDMVHWWLGRLLLIAGAVNVLIGAILVKGGLNVGFIVLLVWLLLVVGYMIAGQVQLGTVSHDADYVPTAEEQKENLEVSIVWRNIGWGVLVAGVIVCIVGVVLADVLPSI